MVDIVSLEDKIVSKIKADIVAAMANRCGRWVSEPFLSIVASNSSKPNVKFGDILNSMINDGTVEKSYETSTDKFHRTIYLPIYRLKISY